MRLDIINNTPTINKMYAEWIPIPRVEINQIKNTRNIIKLNNSNPALDGKTYYYDKNDKNIYVYASIKGRFEIAPIDISLRLREENKNIIN